MVLQLLWGLHTCVKRALLPPLVLGASPRSGAHAPRGPTTASWSLGQRRAFVPQCAVEPGPELEAVDGVGGGELVGPGVGELDEAGADGLVGRCVSL